MCCSGLSRAKEVDAVNQKKTDRFTIIMLVAGLGFYLFFAFFDGAVICVDSPSYINMDSSREPLYPLILAFFRRLFQNMPGEFYLNVVVALQSILAAISTFLLEEYIRKTMFLSKVCATFVLLIPMSVSLLCRFAARRGSMYSNSILTEGIAISLYLLFFRFLIEYVIWNTRKSLFWCAVLTFLMISTRKQMYFSLAMFLVCIGWTAVRKKSVRYGIAVGTVSLALIMGANIGFDIGYNYVLRKQITTHSSDVRFVATVAFYTADREDNELIGDPDIRNLFLKIYDTCDEQEYLGHSAGEGWDNRVSHFGDYYDCIQIDTMWPAINDFVQDKYDCRQDQINEYADQVMRIISYSTIPDNIWRAAQVFLDNFRSGLVTTVARRNHILNIYSVAAYITYIAMLLYLFSKKRNKEVISIAIVTLMSIVFNVGLVALVIFCQTRYTIYNMPLFYISFILMANEIIKIKRETK